MNPEDVKTILDTLFRTGELLLTQAFRLAYRQAIFYGVMDTILAIFFGSVSTWFFKNTSTLWKWYKDPDRRYDTEENFMWMMMSTVMAVITFALALFLLSSGLNGLVNPEMKAIDILLRFLTK